MIRSVFRGVSGAAKQLVHVGRTVRLSVAGGRRGAEAVVRERLSDRQLQQEVLFQADAPKREKVFRKFAHDYPELFTVDKRDFVKNIREVLSRYSPDDLLALAKFTLDQENSRDLWTDQERENWANLHDLVNEARWTSAH